MYLQVFLTFFSAFVHFYVDFMVLWSLKPVPRAFRGWGSTMALVEDATSTASATPYFCLVVLLGALILVNLIVAVLYVQCDDLPEPTPTRTSLKGGQPCSGQVRSQMRQLSGNNEKRRQPADGFASLLTRGSPINAAKTPLSTELADARSNTVYGLLADSA